MAKFEIITTTDSARQRLADILAANPEAQGVKIGVKNSGCAGMEYTVDLVSEINQKDDVVETDQGTIFIAPEAVLFLLGTELDYEITQLRTGFVFNNPNQTSACGCGESVELKAAEMTPEMLQERQR